MITYRADITIYPNKPNDYCIFDNPIATAVLFNQAVRDKFNAKELTKNEGKNSVLLKNINGCLHYCNMTYLIYDYSEEQFFVDNFKYYIQKGSTDYDIRLELEKYEIEDKGVVNV